MALLGLGGQDIASLARVEEVQNLAVDTLEHFSGEGAAERPTNVEGVEHVTHLVRALFSLGLGFRV